MKGTSLTVDDITSVNGTSATSSELSSSEVEESEARTLTFTELKELIESGKTDQIPNNRHIPNDLHVCIADHYIPEDAVIDDV